MWLTFGLGDLHYINFGEDMQSEKGYSELDGKIYCANCSHCVVFKQLLESTSAYVLRVRCSMGLWKKKSGDEKIYKYFSIIRRIMEQCDQYDPMGDEKSFLKDLRKSLPIKDEIYSYSSSHTHEVESRQD
jgi:hypothetical protein